MYIYRGDEKDNLGEHTLQDERDALICDMPEMNMVCFNILYFMQNRAIIIIKMCIKLFVFFILVVSLHQHIQDETLSHLKNGSIILMQKVDCELPKDLYSDSSSVVDYTQMFALKHGNFYWVSIHGIVRLMKERLFAVVKCK